MRLLICLIAGCCLSACAAAERIPPSATEAATRAFVADVCDARILFLGEEEHHSGGRTIQAKSDMIRTLIDRCGFTHVAFEGPFSDFIDLQEQYAAGTATREMLYDAIGGPAGIATEIDSLVELLHAKASRGKLMISGFDPQVVSATAYYTQNLLAQRLARDLPPARREPCSAAIGRLTGWKFDRTHPKDDAFDKSVLGCAQEIEALAAANSTHDPVQHHLAWSFRSVLELPMTEPAGSNERDRLMYENLAWTIGRLPRGTKTIVWTASVHSLRKPRGTSVSMASHAVRSLKTGIKAVAVVAASGAIAMPGAQPAAFGMADADSLEGQLVPARGADYTYIPGEVLRRAGGKKSRLLGYGRYVEANWGELLDGVLVLPAEAPPAYARPLKPMQLPR